MNRAFRTGLFALCLVSFAVSAQAGTANFQGNCSWSGSDIDCVFDALRPTSSPSTCVNGGIPQYFWDYGDGNSYGWTTSSLVGHTYTASAGWFEVDLLVKCPLDSPQISPTKTRVVCVTIGAPGCIFVDGTWD